MTALLRLDGVTLVRGGRQLAEQLSLELGPGERLQLAGPNGSGKSSLIRLAAGLLEPAAGRIDRAEAALADDQPALDRELPLRCALTFWGRPAEVDLAMEALALTRLADVPVRLLSAGQIKRASLARVAASQAPLWLLDEPTNALDSDGAERLAGLVERHIADGGAVIAASHVPLPGDWRRLELGR